MRSLFIVALICLIVCGLGHSAVAQSKSRDKSRDKNNKIKNAAEVEVLIRQHFAGMPNYSQGDLITTQQVQPLLAKFSAKGWDVPRQDLVLAKVTKSGSYLDQTMNSGKGKRFFREINGSPGGIDRVERMSNMKNGRNSIEQLVNKTPRGSDFINALATSKHGQILGDWSGPTQTGQALNQPTGKIYTEEQLIQFFQTLYQQSKAQGNSQHQKSRQ